MRGMCFWVPREESHTGVACVRLVRRQKYARFTRLPVGKDRSSVHTFFQEQKGTNTLPGTTSRFQLMTKIR